MTDMPIDCGENPWPEFSGPKSESDFTKQVLQLAIDCGLLTHFCADARRCAGRRGFPDLVVAGRGGVIFAELKFGQNATSLDQDLWLWTLDAASGRSPVLSVMIWRPDDLRSGEIEKALRELASPTADRKHASRTNGLKELRKARVPR